MKNNVLVGAFVAVLMIGSVELFGQYSAQDAVNRRTQRIAGQYSAQDLEEMRAQAQQRRAQGQAAAQSATVSAEQNEANDIVSAAQARRARVAADRQELTLNQRRRFQRGELDRTNGIASVASRRATVVREVAPPSTTAASTTAVSAETQAPPSTTAATVTTRRALRSEAIDKRAVPSQRDAGRLNFF